MRWLIFADETPEGAVIRAVSVILGIIMIGLVAQANAADLTVDQLRNGKYFIPSWEDDGQGEWVQLKDGEFTRKDPENFLYVKIIDMARGHLSHGRGQGQDAAVIYGYNTGGSGFFVMLCAVLTDQGTPKNSGPVNLEDRVKINSLSIRSGKIVVDMLAHRSTDPAPFPTLRKIVTYSLVGHKLVEQ
jgi:hypothetical protein